jgi:hypothetical protein
MTPLRPNWPAGLPSPKVLQIATDAVCRLYVLPETELHPVTGDQSLQLAYLLTAYGLAPTEPQFPAAPSDMMGNVMAKERRSISRRVTGRLRAYSTQA